MKWSKKESGNFEDRRGLSGGGKAVIGGGIIGIIVFCSICLEAKPDKLSEP